ncbi:TPA: retron Ec48 family effector membrane protein [Aeromonas veronii]
MNNTKELKWFQILMWICIAVTVASLLGSISFELYVDNVFDREVCFEPKCMENFTKIFKDVPPIVNGVVQFLSYIFAIAGVYLALKTYVSNLDAIKTNIHLSHLNSFRSYIELEASRFETISWKSINLFKWYNLACPKSTIGDIGVSQEYMAVINQINEQILRSNKISKASNNGIAFDYQQHQGEMIKIFKKLGVNVSRMPRNNYYEVEGIVLDFIQKVNEEFFRMPESTQIHTRKYH